MGFDVDAFNPGGSASKDATLKAAFADAEDWLLRNAGGCDGFISLGSLDCSLSITYLEQAIGRKFEPSKGDIWPPEEVRALSNAAVWPDPATVRDDQRWAYWSARKFLEICVEHGLGLWTS